MLIVLDSGSGQMCNQMLMQMNVLSSAYARNYKVMWYDFKRYSGVNYNEEIINSLLTIRDKKPKLKVFLVKSFYKLLEILDINCTQIANVDEEEKVKEIFKQNILEKDVMCFGWPFWDFTSLRSHVNLVRRIFEPDRVVKKYVDEILGKFSKDKESIIVGVHLRRGDYKYWCNGEFYFEDEVYKKYMDELRQELGDKKVVFLLFSNEAINESYFMSNEYVVEIAKGTAVQDLYTQSSCDYLIGPPSTFSGVASLLGNVPRYIVTNTSDKLKLDKMKVWLLETDGWVNAL